MKAGEAWLILLNLLWILEGTTANSLAFSLYFFFALSFGSLLNLFSQYKPIFLGLWFTIWAFFYFLLR